MLIKVKVFTKASKQAIIEKDKNLFQIKVKEEAKAGKANKAVIKLLASHFHLSKFDVKLIKGGHSRNKVFKINIKE